MITQSRPAIGCSLVLLALLSCRSADAPYDPVRAEADIREIEQAWAQVAVSGDVAVIERIFADDFLGVSPEGQHYTKREFIENTRSHPLGYVSNRLNDVKVRFFGNVAVAQGNETFAKKSGEQGRYVWTDVLEHRDGRWQIVAAQDVVAPPTPEAASAAPFSGADEGSEARREIDKTRAAYAAARQAGDADQIAKLYASDAWLLYPGQGPLSGRAAILDYFGGFFADFPNNEFALSSAEVVVSGDWAFDRGTYRWSAIPAGGGSAQEDSGKYLVVLQRQPDGRWLVAREMNNSDRPAPEETRDSL
jgi:uncharacterized protein (TIGR02246 family)